MAKKILGLAAPKINRRRFSPYDFLKQCKRLTEKSVMTIKVRLVDFADFVLVPAFLTGKVFKKGRFDELTQIGTEGFNAVFFCDEFDAKVHAKLYNNPNMYLVRHPASGGCRCIGVAQNNKNILSPLSGFVGRDSVPGHWLHLFYRDFKTVMDNAGAKELHLRLHPRETGKWPYQLRDYLINRCIPAKIVGAEKPVKEVICDYMGIAGFTSGALRDARFACDYAFVVGFVAVSKSRYNDPRFVYGKAEGIGWIEEDGTFNPGIFNRNKFIASPRKNAAEQLLELQKA